MNSRCTAVVLLVFSLLLPLSASAQNENPKPVRITTFDHFNLAGDYYPGADGKPGIVLSHMLNRNRRDWKDFAKKLQSEGYHVLAIDLRGHGSTLFNDKRIKWRVLSKSVFAHVSNDPAVAANWLRKQNRVAKDRIALIGASVGANASLVAAAQKNAGVKTVVLLSPGLNYREVTTDKAIKSYSGPVLIVAADGDKYSYESSRKLDEWGKDTVLKIYAGKHHGTNIFHAYGDLEPLILKWLKNKL